MRPLLAVDFDRTLAKYERWVDHDHLGDPIPGAIEFLRDLFNAGFSICIFTARATEPEGTAAVWEWLAKAGVEQLVDSVTNVKSYSIARIVDDRALEFTPDAPNYDDILDRLCDYYEKPRPIDPALTRPL